MTLAEQADAATTRDALAAMARLRGLCAEPVSLGAIDTLTCDNRSAPVEAWNSPQGLTHSLDLTKEGLEVNSTQQQGSLRECKTCGELRPADGYYIQRVDGKEYPAKTCKRCHRAQRTESGRKVVARRNGQPARPRKTLGGMTATERRAHWATFKVRAGCTDCGRNDDWRILQFDHLPGFEKSFEISYAINRTSDFGDDEIAHEVTKCEVVCFDCHVIRTATRLEIDPASKHPAWVLLRARSELPATTEPTGGTP